ncbi:MAG: hypothetical protein VB859_13935 [Planctomycetaceae bacterium]
METDILEQAAIIFSDQCGREFFRSERRQGIGGRLHLQWLVNEPFVGCRVIERDVVLFGQRPADDGGDHGLETGGNYRRRAGIDLCVTTGGLHLDLFNASSCRHRIERAEGAKQ